MQNLNKICFTVSIITVVLATLLAFALIWGEGDREFLWKSELSLGVLFMASAATLSVSKTMGPRDRATPNRKSVRETEEQDA